MGDSAQSQWRVTLLSHFNILNRFKPETIQRSASHILEQCRGYATEVLAIWYNDFRSASAKRQLCFLYVANEVMMHEKKTGSTLFHEKFCKVLGPCLYRYSQNKDAEIDRVERMMESTWKRFSLFDKEQLKKFQHCFNGEDEQIKLMVDSNQDTFDVVFNGVKITSKGDYQIGDINNTSGTKADSNELAADEDEYENKTLVQANKLLETGWEGMSTFEEVRNIIEQCHDDVDNANVTLNNSQLEIINSIATAAEADIRDDFVSSKVSKHSDNMNKIVSNIEQDDESKGLGKEKADDTTMGESYYSIKISEEKVELDLDEFEKDLLDHQLRVQTAGTRRGTLMDSLADMLGTETATLETTQKEENFKTDSLESFKKINRLIKSAVRKRKRQKEAAKKSAEEEQKNRKKTAQEILASIQQSLNDKPKPAGQPTTQTHYHQQQHGQSHYYAAGYQNQYHYQNQYPNQYQNPQQPRSIVPQQQQQQQPQQYYQQQGQPSYYQQQGQPKYYQSNQYRSNQGGSRK